MFEELKETIYKELKESMRLMSHQIENIGKREFRNDPKEILKLNVTIAEIKILLEKITIIKIKNLQQQI